MKLLRKLRRNYEARERLRAIRKIALRYLSILQEKKGIEQEQRQLLTDYLLYVQEHSSYYRELLSDKIITIENCINVINGLPLCSKGLIRKNGKAIYSDEIEDGWNDWLNTGGSTGEPLHFPIKSANIDLEQIHQMMLYLDMGWNFSDLIVSIDAGLTHYNIYFICLYYCLLIINLSPVI